MALMKSATRLTSKGQVFVPKPVREQLREGAVMLGRQGAEFRPPRPNEVNQYVAVHV